MSNVRGKASSAVRSGGTFSGTLGTGKVLRGVLYGSDGLCEVVRCKERYGKACSKASLDKLLHDKSGYGVFLYGKSCSEVRSSWVRLGNVLWVLVCYGLTRRALWSV